MRTKLLVFAALFLLLRLEGEGFKELGLSGHQWPKHLGLGLLFGLGMFFALNVALGAVMQSLLPRPAGTGPTIMSFFNEPRNLLAWLPIGIFGGGVVEELQRIFIFTRFEKWLGRPGLILGIVLSSLMFGLGHRYQGLGIAISTAVSGAIFALVYLRRRSPSSRSPRTRSATCLPCWSQRCTSGNATRHRPLLPFAAPGDVKPLFALCLSFVAEKRVQLRFRTAVC